MPHPEKNRWIPIICSLIVGVFLLILLFPGSREIFRAMSAAHPMIMGFAKFALLATIGELLAGRLTQKRWQLPVFIGARVLIWGFIGAVLALMLKLYSGGVAALLAEGILPGEGGLFIKAAATSILMNITFGPVMMAFHKMTDCYLELRAGRQRGEASGQHILQDADVKNSCQAGVDGRSRRYLGAQDSDQPEERRRLQRRSHVRLSVGDIAEAVDWRTFYTFVVLRTIPLFWFPAHTLTFMLPTEYQTIMAAFLSMALGIILSLRKT